MEGDFGSVPEGVAAAVCEAVPVLAAETLLLTAAAGLPLRLIVAAAVMLAAAVPDTVREAEGVDDEPNEMELEGDAVMVAAADGDRLTTE